VEFILVVGGGGGGGGDGKLGTTACAIQEGFNFPLQIKKLPQRLRILMWVPCGVKGFSEIEAVYTLFFKSQSHTLKCRAAMCMQPNSQT